MSWHALWTQPWFWARPWGWALLAVPLLLAALRWRRARASRAVALAYADAALLPFATRLASARARWRLLAWDVLIWALLAAAAAGPRQPLQDASGQGDGLHHVAVMVLMDASAQAEAPASAASLTGLEQQRLLLRALWPQLRGERLGLLAYGAARPGGFMGAVQLLPPTRDPALFAHAAQQARPALFAALQSGVVLPDVLRLAQQRLRDQAEGAPQALLLLAGPGTTVPADFDADTTGAALRRAGLPLFVLALPGLQADAAALLRRTAAASGGRTAAVQPGQTGPSAWAMLYAAGLARIPSPSNLPQTISAWRALDALFLLPALVLLLWRERPRRLRSAPALFVVLLLALPQPQPAQAAQPAPDARASVQAWQAWQHGDWQRAYDGYILLPGYAARMGEGAAAYRLQQFQSASQAFERALLLADTAPQRFAALYNLGNASLHLPGGSLKAVQAFDAALRLRPGDPNALRNARLAQRIYAINHPEAAFTGIAKRGPPSTVSHFGKQKSDTPSQLRHKPPPRASAPLPQQATPLGTGQLAPRTVTGASAAAPWQPPALDWAAADKRLQLLHAGDGALLAARVELDTRAAAPRSAP